MEKSCDDVEESRDDVEKSSPRPRGIFSVTIPAAVFTARVFETSCRDFPTTSREERRTSRDTVRQARDSSRSSHESYTTGKESMTTWKDSSSAARDSDPSPRKSAGPRWIARRREMTSSGRLVTPRGRVMTPRRRRAIQSDRRTISTCAARNPAVPPSPRRCWGEALRPVDDPRAPATAPGHALRVRDVRALGAHELEEPPDVGADRSAHRRACAGPRRERRDCAALALADDAPRARVVVAAPHFGCLLDDDGGRPESQDKAVEEVQVVLGLEAPQPLDDRRPCPGD